MTSKTVREVINVLLNTSLMLLLMTWPKSVFDFIFAMFSLILSKTTTVSVRE